MINWRDATKELPAYDIECVVLYTMTGYEKDYRRSIKITSIDNKGHWANINDYDDYLTVTHWCYISEFQMPRIFKKKELNNG